MTTERQHSARRQHATRSAAAPSSSVKELEADLTALAGGRVDPFQDLGEVAAVLDGDRHRLVADEGGDPLVQGRRERLGEIASDQRAGISLGEGAAAAQPRILAWEAPTE